MTEQNKLPDEVTIMLNTVVGYYQVSDVPDKWKENFREVKGVGFVGDYVKKSNSVSKDAIKKLIEKLTMYKDKEEEFTKSWSVKPFTDYWGVRVKILSACITEVQNLLDGGTE